ncbi:MAG: hypothetical protein QOF06_1999 [Solirubrobacterales bacterium]|jgi:hypothetical protein|nr:hypothetical protein [Solirubrobacterales bacterium]
MAQFLALPAEKLWAVQKQQSKDGMKRLELEEIRLGSYLLLFTLARDA